MPRALSDVVFAPSLGCCVLTPGAAQPAAVQPGYPARSDPALSDGSGSVTAHALGQCAPCRNTDEHRRRQRRRRGSVRPPDGGSAGHSATWALNRWDLGPRPLKKQCGSSGHCRRRSPIWRATPYAVPASITTAAECAPNWPKHATVGPRWPSQRWRAVGVSCTSAGSHSSTANCSGSRRRKRFGQSMSLRSLVHLMSGVAWLTMART